VETKVVVRNLVGDKGNVLSAKGDDPSDAFPANTAGRQAWERHPTAGIALFFSLLSLVATYPLVGHLTDAIPGPPWDNFNWLFDVWWFKEAIFVRGTSPLFQPEIFYPTGYAFGTSDAVWANKLLAIPFLLWGGDVLAYNLTVLGSFVLSGLGAYLLVYLLTGRKGPALLAGTIFALTPFRTATVAAGWLPTFPTQWLAFTLVALELTLRRRRLRHGLLAGLFLALHALTSWYYTFLAVIFVPLYLLLRCRRASRKLLSAAWRPLALGTAVTGLLVTPAFWITLQADSGGHLAWSLFDVELWAASLSDFFVPSIYHSLWGRMTLLWHGPVPAYPWYTPGMLYLGWIPLVLAGWALWRHRRHRILWGGWAVTGALLALGTTLHWAGERVYLQGPPQIQYYLYRLLFTLSRIAPHPLEAPRRLFYAIPHGFFIPLPALLAHMFVPFMASIRWWVRFGLVTVLGISVLAGLGWAGLQRRYPRLRRGSVTALLLLGVVIEFAAFPFTAGLSRVAPQPVDRWLAAQPGQGAVIQFPLIKSKNGPALYSYVFHRKPLAYGFGSFYPPAWQGAEKKLAGFPDDASLTILRQWGVRYVIVSPSLYDAGWADRPNDTWDDIQPKLKEQPVLHFVGKYPEESLRLGDKVTSHVRGTRLPFDQGDVLVYELQP